MAPNFCESSGLHRHRSIDCSSLHCFCHFRGFRDLNPAVNIRGCGCLNYSGKKKTNKHKEFWRDTPWFESHLSRGHVPSVPSSVPSVPRTFCPLNVNFHINRPKTSRVSLGRPEFIPGTLPGHSHHKIPLCDISLMVFCSP